MDRRNFLKTVTAGTVVLSTVPLITSAKPESVFAEDSLPGTIWYDRNQLIMDKIWMQVHVVKGKGQYAYYLNRKKYQVEASNELRGEIKKVAGVFIPPITEEVTGNGFYRPVLIKGTI